MGNRIELSSLKHPGLIIGGRPKGFGLTRMVHAMPQKESLVSKSTVLSQNMLDNIVVNLNNFSIY